MGIRFIIALTLCSHTLFSQNWQNMGAGANWPVRVLYSDGANNLYAGGTFDSICGTAADGIAKWDGNQWSSLSSGPSIGVLAIAEYNSELYAGGFGGIKKWNGISWSSVGINSNGPIYSLYVFNNELYVGGFFDSIGGIQANGLAKWNGVYWSDVGGLPNYNSNGIYNAIYDVIAFNGELYAAGNFKWIGGVEMDIVKWDGTNWNPVGNGFTGNFTWVSSLQVFNNELYAGGSFHLYDGNPGDAVVKWNGSNWVDVGGGMPGANTHVDKLKVINSHLYAVGGFQIAGGVPAMVMAKWDGANWCGFGINSSGSFVDVVQHVGEIYVASDQFLDGDTVNYIAKWIGGNYVDTCGNTTAIGESSTSNIDFTFYPNPVHYVGTFEAHGTEGNFTMVICDQLGREIFRQVSDGIRLDFTTEEIAPGLYYYSIVQDDEIQKSGKMIIE